METWIPQLSNRFCVFTFLPSDHTEKHDKTYIIYYLHCPRV